MEISIPPSSPSSTRAQATGGKNGRTARALPPRPQRRADRIPIRSARSRSKLVCLLKANLRVIISRENPLPECKIQFCPSDRLRANLRRPDFSFGVCFISHGGITEFIYPKNCVVGLGLGPQADDAHDIQFHSVWVSKWTVSGADFRHAPRTQSPCSPFKSWMALKISSMRSSVAAMISAQARSSSLINAGTSEGDL